MQRRGYDTENPDNPVLALELVNRIEMHFKKNFYKPGPFEEWKLIYDSTSQGRNNDIELLLELIELMEAYISFQYLIGGHFINCWHQNECESGKMWEEYTQKGEGICIKSNIKRLKECFAEDEKHEVKIGTVSYIDYSTDYLPPDKNMHYIFTHKDKEKCGYENEVRAYVLMKGREYRDKKCICVPVSLDILIEKIYISPIADEQLLNSVKSITEKYDLKKEIILSDLHN
ncbi:hypothetical protein [Methanosarcina sp.]|uniref:hypothetical protein n=1 Tax=Methanosarcina sp. TaxID=2213 RepID=UPI003C7468E4